MWDAKCKISRGYVSMLVVALRFWVFNKCLKCLRFLLSGVVRCVVLYHSISHHITPHQSTPHHTTSHPIITTTGKSYATTYIPRFVRLLWSPWKSADGLGSFCSRFVARGSFRQRSFRAWLSQLFVNCSKSWWRKPCVFPVIPFLV